LWLEREAFEEGPLTLFVGERERGGRAEGLLQGRAQGSLRTVQSRGDGVIDWIRSARVRIFCLRTEIIMHKTERLGPVSTGLASQFVPYFSKGRCWHSRGHQGRLFCGLTLFKSELLLSLLPHFEVGNPEAPGCRS
jgi:hypothetical protein